MLPRYLKIMIGIAIVFLALNILSIFGISSISPGYFHIMTAITVASIAVETKKQEVKPVLLNIIMFIAISTMSFFFGIYLLGQTHGIFP